MDGTDGVGGPRALAAVPADARGMRLWFRLEDSMNTDTRASRKTRIQDCPRPAFVISSALRRVFLQWAPTGPDRRFLPAQGKRRWFHPVIDADSMICVSNKGPTRRGRPGLDPARHPKSESQIPQQDKPPRARFSHRRHRSPRTCSRALSCVRCWASCTVPVCSHLESRTARVRQPRGEGRGGVRRRHAHWRPTAPSHTTHHPLPAHTHPHPSRGCSV